ncbi:hypothetical protein PsYK624_107830 [Phanerochaete sordida]|uniref:Uncharacterized protein n=1 Tax=Phanerochaete sordida TaxID=48140 RepID=A0A9P3GF98_9APHY|nr:hypothetical protein PsYK624_107830 [Phanerochaete sordida]
MKQGSPKLHKAPHKKEGSEGKLAFSVAASCDPIFPRLARQRSGWLILHRRTGPVQLRRSVDVIPHTRRAARTPDSAAARAPARIPARRPLGDGSHQDRPPACHVHRRSHTRRAQTPPRRPFAPRTRPRIRRRRAEGCNVALSLP